jgi:hypothetical protein
MLFDYLLIPEGCDVYRKISNSNHTTMCPRVKIYYQFHPYFQKELTVVCQPRDEKGLYTVLDPEGKTLKIPHWMTHEESALYHISEIASIHYNALISLGDRIETLTRKVPYHV